MNTLRIAKISNRMGKQIEKDLEQLREGSKRLSSLCYAGLDSPTEV